MRRRREEEEGIFYCVSFVAHEHAWQGSKGSRRRRQVVREEKERGREREREGETESEGGFGNGRCCERRQMM